MWCVVWCVCVCVVWMRVVMVIYIRSVHAINRTRLMFVPTAYIDFVSVVAIMDVYDVNVIDSNHPVFITIAYIPFVSVMDMINIYNVHRINRLVLTTDIYITSGRCPSHSHHEPSPSIISHHFPVTQHTSYPTNHPPFHLRP